MFTIKQAVESFFGWGKEAENSDSDDDSVDVDAIIERNTRNESSTPNLLQPVNHEPSLLQQRVGTVTKLCTDYGIIDGKYHLTLRGPLCSQLKVGCRITYSAYRASEQEEWRATHIANVLDEDWGAPDNSDSLAVNELEEPEVLTDSLVHKRTIIGEVVRKVGRSLTVRHSTQELANRQIVPRDEVLDMDKIKSSYIPIEGDIAFLEVVVEVDESITDLCGSVQDVLSIRPKGCALTSGKVTSWNARGKWGVINNTIHFTRDVCESGYVPRVNDEVEVDSAENKRHGVRALSVKPTRNYQREMSEEPLTSADPSLLIPSIDPDLARNKGDVSVTEDASGKINIGKININENKNVTVSVTNTGWNCYKIRTYYLKGMTDESQEKDEFSGRSQNIKVLRPVKKIDLGRDHTFQIPLMCTGNHYGHFTATLIIDFVKFQIGRLLLWEVVQERMFNEMTKDAVVGAEVRHGLGREDLIEAQRCQDKRSVLIVPGQKFKRGPNFTLKKLHNFPVPERVENAIVRCAETSSKSMNANRKEALKKLEPALFDDLTVSSYRVKFHHLLYVAEIDAMIEMRRYDMKRAVFKPVGPKGEFLALQVPGLAEKRPSLLVSDKIFAKNCWMNDAATPYEGYIHKVCKDEIWVAFAPGFHSQYNGEDYDVSFEVNRGSFRKCHQAIMLNWENKAHEWLFASHVGSKPPLVLVEASTNSSKPIHESAVSTPTNENSASESKSADAFFAQFQSSPPKPDKSSCKNISTLEQVECSMKESLNEYSSVQPLKDTTSQDNSKPTRNILGVLRAARSQENQRNGENSPPPTTAPNVTDSNAEKGEVNSKDKNAEKGEVNSKDKKHVTRADLQVALAKANEVLRGVECAAKKKEIKWCNSRLNSRQRDAVLRVLRGEARPLPYIIFGPPGTGKTVTLVEMILQTYLLQPQSRLLVATPSNSSADLIALRLLESGFLEPGDMVRLVAFHIVADGKIPPKLVPYSSTCDFGSNDPKSQNQGPSNIALGRHRITVGTCVTLGSLYQLGLPPGHFSHVVIDEAGQATEPEVLIPLAFMDRVNGQAVLAGDPNQLGPVVQSRMAAELGLSVSLLSRLMPRFPYTRDSEGFPDTGGYDPRLVTRLCVNYRSLPDILELPSSLFYDSDLVATICEENSFEANLMNKVCRALQVPNSAVVFHGIRGMNLRDHDSPSWYNPHEVNQVLGYMTILYGAGINPDDVGIITPYQKQVQKIRYFLEKLDMPIPKVGSVEEFQGQERMIIILSTVRSVEDGKESDTKYNLGFINSRERLNVAITRARALLLILGDPHVLQADCYWRSVLQYCSNRQAVVGCELPPGILED